MKVKKAAKRLNRIETLLSGVLNGYTGNTAELREPLKAAVAAVRRARSAIDSGQSSDNRQTNPEAGRTPQRPDRASVETRKGSGVAKRRSANANERGGRAATASAASHGKFSKPKKGVSPRAGKRIAEGNTRRRANRGAGRSAQTIAAQREISAGKETTAGESGTATPAAMPA